MRVRTLLSAAFICMAASASAHAESGPGSGASQSIRLRHFLDGYLRERDGSLDPTTRFASAFVDLNGDGIAEAIVFLTGGGWCGSGGCKTLVLTPVGPSYGVLMSASVTRLPIHILPTSRHGWRDIGVGVSGGGGESSEAVMSFDGRRYPENPTAPPAHTIGGETGQIVLGTDAKSGPL